MALHDESSDAVRDPSLRWVTVPNALSLIRLALTPVVVWLILDASPTALTLCLVLMIAAELTDFLDGYLARVLKQETEIGRLIDPVFDVIYHVSVFLAFVKQGWMAPWMLFVIYARDLAVPYMRTIARQRGIDIAVRFSGKVKTAIHGSAQIMVVLVALGVLAQTLPGGLDTMFVVLVLAAVTSIISLFDYAYLALGPK